MCLRLVPGLRKAGLGALDDREQITGPRAEFVLEGFLDCNAAMFNIPSMSNDCKDARKSGDCGACTMSFRGEGVEFAGYPWSSGTTWAQVAIA